MSQQSAGSLAEKLGYFEIKNLNYPTYSNLQHRQDGITVNKSQR